MELDVLEVQKARTRAARHREAVSPRALRISGVQVDLAEPAGREDRLAGEMGVTEAVLRSSRWARSPGGR